MLSFDSSLTDALTTHSTTAFWVLKLYYNDESSFYGVSDQDRIDGSDTYYGIVSSWGNLNQSLDFFNFTTSTRNMSVKLINTDNTIEGGRFSDLFSTNNFANRKWELFLNTNRAGTYDTAARMIGTGIISGDIKYDPKFITLTLLDKSSTYHKQLPTNVVDLATYPNAPEKNIDKPIPIAYGDFYEKTDIGTIPTTLFDRFKTFYKGAFPAIITDRFDVGVAGSEANVDSQAIHTLSDENVYYYKSGHYATLMGTVDATSNNPVIEFEGSRCKTYVPLSSSGFTTSGSGTYSHTYETNISNGDFGDSNKTTLVVGSGDWVTVDYGVEPVSKQGEYVGVTGLAKFGTISGTFTGSDMLTLGGQAFSNPVTNDEKEAALVFSAAERSSWDFTGGITMMAYSNFGAKSVEISELGIVVEFDIDDIEPYKTQELYEETIVGWGGNIQTQFEWENEGFCETIIKTRTKITSIPSEIDYVYCSGKGRKYPAFIDADSRNQGYNETDLIENPVFMIEDALRTELSKTSSEIDYAAFDTSGNTTNGYLGDIFNDAVGDVKFAFSQYKFINSKDFINRICKQILSWVFISGDGKFKIKTLRRTGDYASADKTIDFNDINLKNISRTSLGAVRNDITINYNQDYGQDQFVSNVNTTDATSQGTTVNGVSQSLKLELDADILDSTTATQLADAYKTIFKDRKVILDFECLRPYYNDLEIGDIILFSNWDSNIKIYGAAMGTDYYLITSISKKPNRCSLKAIKVS